MLTPLGELRSGEGALIGTLLGLAGTVFTGAAAAGFSFSIGAEGFVLSTVIVFLRGAFAAGLDTTEISFSVEVFFSKDLFGSDETFSLALLALISDNLAA